MESYKTLAAPSAPILYKEKNSKFLGYAFPVESEQEIKQILDTLRKAEPNAVHHCYAWQLGTTQIRYRANDDGEPAHTAGTPIYGQIQSYGLTNVLVVIIRYFGGIKLGVGGLISAYRMATQMALDEATIIEKPITREFEISFGYPDMNKAMRIIKEKNLEIVSQEMALDCKIVVSAGVNQADNAIEAFKSVYGITVRQE